MTPLPMSTNQPSQNADALLLSRTRVATPCHADWSQMVGDEKSRFCGSCKKNVYNLSAMTGKEAAALIREKEGKLCVRYYQRADGTVLTQDCPVGIAAVKRKMTRALAAVVVGVASGLMLVCEAMRFGANQPSLFAERMHVWAERIHPTTIPAVPERIPSVPQSTPTPAPVETPTATMGAPIAPMTMGEIVAPEPRITMGKPRFIPTPDKGRVILQERVK